VSQNHVDGIVQAARLIAESLERWQIARAIGHNDLGQIIMQTGLACGLLMTVLNTTPATPSEREIHTLDQLAQTLSALSASLSEMASRVPKTPLPETKAPLPKDQTDGKQ
jgi:hypothetical protein